MSTNCPISKDELYGPPPAYSITNQIEQVSPTLAPPSYTPSIYILPLPDENAAVRSFYHGSISLSQRFSRYLLGSGLIHMIFGLFVIVCDIILTIMNESYSFTGLWSGAAGIVLGIYLILFMSRSHKTMCSLERLQFFYLVMGLIVIIALVLSSINLASDSCYKVFLGPDRCEHSAYTIKIVLVTIYSLTLAQICLSICLIRNENNKFRQNLQSTLFS